MRVARGSRILHSTGFGTKLTEGKETKVFDGKEYVLKPGITASFRS